MKFHIELAQAHVRATRRSLRNFMDIWDPDQHLPAAVFEITVVWLRHSYSSLPRNAMVLQNAFCRFARLSQFRHYSNVANGKIGLFKERLAHRECGTRTAESRSRGRCRNRAIDLVKSRRRRNDVFVRFSGEAHKDLSDVLDKRRTVIVIVSVREGERELFPPRSHSLADNRSS